MNPNRPGNKPVDILQPLPKDTITLEEYRRNKTEQKAKQLFESDLL